GKLSAAVALCRALLCRDASSAPCGSCDPCRRVSDTALFHPDLGLLHPQRGRSPEGGGEDGGEEDDSAPLLSGSLDLQALQEEIRRNPAWRIPAERTRERLRDLYLSPGSSRRRILLVLAAERLGAISGNILLKVLEEPPGGAVILLLSESASALLPTLRSRCQSCRFAPLPRKEVESIVTDRLALPAESAALVASLSGGRPGLALELARDAEVYRSRRDLLCRLLIALRQESSAAAPLAAARELLSDE